MINRRDFLKKAGVAGVAAGAATLAAPAVHAQAPIKWRFQTYAGAALGQFVTKPVIDAFNKAANGEMEIELYSADQLVPTGELFRAMQQGTIDAVHSDDDSMAAPVDISVFGGYFPLATKHALDVPALFHQYGLNEVWKEAYDEIDGVVVVDVCRVHAGGRLTQEEIAESGDRVGEIDGAAEIDVAAEEFISGCVHGPEQAAQNMVSEERLAVGGNVVTHRRVPGPSSSVLAGP